MEPAVRIRGHQDFEREHLKEIAQVAASERDIITELWVSKKQRIKLYEKSIAERLELGDRTLEIFAKSQISSYIAQKYRKEGASEGALAYIRELLEEEHKNPNKMREQENDNGNGLVFKDADSEVNLANKKLLSKPIDQMDHATAIEDAQKIKRYAEQVRALQKAIGDTSRVLQEKADANNWTDVKLKTKSTTADTPEPRRGPYHQLLRDLGQAILDYSDIVEKYPPSEEDEERYIESTKPYLELMRSLNDEKFTQSAVGWIETIKTMHAGHKHAAAVLHGTTAKIKQYYTDEDGNDTFRWVEVPRSFTREQVGDKAEGTLELAIEIIKTQGVFNAMAECRDKYSQPYIAGRKVKLHDELSELA